MKIILTKNLILLIVLGVWLEKRIKSTS